MTRIVVDTNITVSAFLWGGLPKLIFQIAAERDIVLLSSDEMVRELGRTLAKPKLQKYVTLTGKTVSQLVSDYSQMVTLIEPVDIPIDAIRDPDDAIVLAVAVAGRATHIVTGDDDLLTLKTYAGVSIMKVRDLLDTIR